MGCNVEKAKLEIYEILVKDQKKSDKKTVENIEKLAEDIASKLDNDIKSNFIMSKNKNTKGAEAELKKESKVHSGVSKAISIFEKLNDSNSKTSNVVKPLLREYFKKQKLSTKPFMDAITLALNGDISRKATAQQGGRAKDALRRCVW